MKQLAPTAESSALVIAFATDSLPFPPQTFARVPSGWSGRGGDDDGEIFSKNGGVVPEVDFDFWATSGVELSNIRLLCGKLRLIDFAPVSFQVTEGNTLSAEVDIFTGDGPFHFSATTSLPATVLPDHDYWVVGDGSSFMLADSFEDAIAEEPVLSITITDNVVGMTAMTGTDETRRLIWNVMGNDVLDTFELAANLGYVYRASHRPGVVAYAISGDTDGQMYASVTPVTDNVE